MKVRSSVAALIWLMMFGSFTVMAQEPEGDAEQADATPTTAAEELGEERAIMVRDTAQAMVPEEPQEEDVALRVDDAPGAGEAVAESVRRRERQLRRRIHLMLTGNMDGNFARVNCREERGYRDLYWAKHVAYYQALNELSEAEGLDAPLALNVGNSIFPGALGRYLSTREDVGGQRLAEILAEIPMEAHGLGHREFAAPRGALVDFLEAMEERQIDMQAVNLECDSFGGAEAICEAIGADSPYRVVEREGVRIAITTVVAEERFASVAASQREGLRLLDPKEVLPPLIEEMRQDADLVVVQHQVPRSEAAPLAYDLGSKIEGIDLIIASHLIDEAGEGGPFDPPTPIGGGRTAVITAAATGTPIISANSAQHSAINVELSVKGYEEDDPQWTLRKVIPRRIMLQDIAHHEPTEELLRESVNQFCEDWGDALGEHARLHEPMEMADFQQFVLNVMRFSEHAEVAISNRRSFRNEQQFPFTDFLTVADVYSTLPYENRLVVADISGSVLQGLGSRLDDDLVGMGITVDGGTVRINGRSPNPDRIYRVAINEYLADGGDGVFGPDDFANRAFHHPDWSAEEPTIGDVVIEYVRAGEHLRRGPQREALSARDNFPDLHRKFLWELLSSVNASYNQVMVENPLIDDSPAYDQGQLTVQSTDQINLEGRLAANADSRNHGWNNELTAQYATARISDDDVGFEETSDQVRLRSRYRYKRLRVDQEGSWYIPDPVVEGQAESEFRRPDTRDWHRLDLRAIAGASFQILEPLDVRIGANIRQDINEPDGVATYGLNLSYTLSRINLLRIADRPVRFESEVEYFYNDIGNLNIHEARSRNRLYFAMFNQFFFTTTFNAFLYRDDNVGELGSNTELTIGINYEWEMSRQNF